MTHIEQAFYEKSIKGVTVKLIITVMISTITIVASGVWAVSNAYSDLKQSLKDEKNQSMQFTKDQISTLRDEMNARFDTIKINQIMFNYNTKMDIQRNHNQSSVTGYVTETRAANGKVTPHRVSN